MAFFGQLKFYFFNKVLAWPFHSDDVPGFSAAVIMLYSKKKIQCFHFSYYKKKFPFFFFITKIFLKKLNP